MSPAQSQAAFCRERRRTSGGRTLHKPGPREPSSTASQHLLSPAQNPEMEPIDRVWVGHNRNGPGYQRRPPIKPEAQKREADRAAKNKGHEFDGPENRSLSERCIMWPHEGPPMLPIPVNVNYLQVVQGPGYVSILQEMIHDVRIIPTDGRPHLPPGIRLWQGDSVGHWEGNTLVVDVTNFSGRAAFFFGGLGLFQGVSQNLHVVERFTRNADDSILYEFTVDDPATWTRPWSAQIPWARAKGPIYEY